MVLRALHRPTWVRLAVAALLVLLVAVAGVAALLRYQPLQQAGDLEPGSTMQVATIAEFEESGAHFLRYSDDDYVSYAFTLRNTGPVGVTVTDVRLPQERERRLLQPVAAGLASGTSTDADSMAPFEPFSLRPGEEQRIIIRGRFDNCEYYTERAIEIVDGHTVDFSVAGIERSATVPFARDLLVRSPTIQRCDDRTLDRSEHRRTAPDGP